MKPRTLLTTTAAIEAGTGVALTVAPSWVVLLLLGSPLEQPASLVVGRILGAALISLGVACWLARTETWGLIVAVLVYNIAVVSVLCYVCIGMRISGVGLLPAVVLHSALSVGCAACLRNLAR